MPFVLRRFVPAQWTTWILCWSMLYGSPAFPCVAETAPNDVAPTLQHDKNNDLTYYSDEEDVCCRPSEFPLTAEEIDRHIDEFINNIDEEAIGQLASRHNDQKPWKRIAGRTHGSFNVCFFVQFDDDTTLVVRIPLNPVVNQVWTKVQSEVATIQYLWHKTKIPVPRVRAYGQDTTLTKSGSETLAFIISDYIPGQSPSIKVLQDATEEQQRRFFDEMIDIFAQLRQLEFPQAGSLMPNPGHKSDPIVSGLLTMAANELHRYQKEQQNPGPFDSARVFLDYQYHILSETCRLPSEYLERATAEEELFALASLAKQIPTLCNPQSPNGPFILTHLDLRCGNIIVNADFGIAAIIDWEFSGTVPLEYFTPPLWITGHGRGGYIYLATDTISNGFYQVLRTKAVTSNKCAQLMQEWNLQPELAFPIVQILRQPETLLHVFYRFIFRIFFKGDREQVISEFFAQNDDNGTLAVEIRRRVENSKHYVQYLSEHGLLVVDEEAEKREQELLAMLKSGIAALDEKYGPTNQAKGDHPVPGFT
ncbi:aminoglycoside 3'-phosphotransferase/choline kinase domain protein [Metarhizium robertsii]|uniref:Phosphotransferase n=2 Tax=Metarhizium robertsii TaxID=568076 RepID=E9EP74_METRA|nr:phosphotransferase [Metarhizium robertsii ARSEF 23]EFZ02084.1 phosphotransferase [Metarhizium robertsii ARSEF 23]EXU98248.1 aminoglycoside 3'-phosphotransferase/choline kinase domain protein [Metarhizium robertsii]